MFEIVRGHIGQLILTVAFGIPVITQIFMDFSRTHIFNPEWLPHARFHNALHVFQLVLTLPLVLWLVWTTPINSDERMVVSLVATAVTVVWGIPFFLASLVPGTSFEAYPNTIPWVGLVPVNLFATCVLIPLAILGFFIESWEAGAAKIGGGAWLAPSVSIAPTLIALGILFIACYGVAAVIVRTRRR
jgi:hypothetical protein